jgi:hypothetical protein
MSGVLGSPEHTAAPEAGPRFREHFSVRPAPHFASTLGESRHALDSDFRTVYELLREVVLSVPCVLTIDFACHVYLLSILFEWKVQKPWLYAVDATAPGSVRYVMAGVRSVVGSHHLLVMHATRADPANATGVRAVETPKRTANPLIGHFATFVCSSANSQ